MNLENCERAVRDAGGQSFSSECHIVLSAGASVNSEGMSPTKDDFRAVVNLADPIKMSLPAGTRQLYRNGTARLNSVELVSSQNSTKVPLLLVEEAGKLPPRTQVAGPSFAKPLHGLAHIPASTFASTGSAVTLFDDAAESCDHAAGGLTMDQQSLYSKLDLGTLKKAGVPTGDANTTMYTSPYTDDADGDPFLALICKNYHKFPENTFTAIATGSKFGIVMPTKVFSKLYECVEKKIACNMLASNLPLSKHAGDVERQRMTYLFQPITNVSTAANANAAYAELCPNGQVTAHLKLKFTVSSARDMEEANAEGAAQDF